MQITLLPQYHLLFFCVLIMQLISLVISWFDSIYINNTDLTGRYLLDSQQTLIFHIYVSDTTIQLNSNNYNTNADLNFCTHDLIDLQQSTFFL